MDYDEKPDAPNHSRDGWIGLVDARDKEIASLKEKLKEMEEIAEWLSAVMSAKFFAAMEGKPLGDLDAWVSPAHLKQEKEAVAFVIERLSPKWRALQDVANKARLVTSTLSLEGATEAFISGNVHKLFYALKALDSHDSD